MGGGLELVVQRDRVVPGGGSVLLIFGRVFGGDGTSGGRWCSRTRSGVTSGTARTVSPGGMEQQGLGGGRVLMDERSGVVWRHGGVDGRPDKVYALVPALKMDRWKTAAATSESVSDRCVPRHGMRLG